MPNLMRVLEKNSRSLWSQSAGWKGRKT